MIYVDFMKQQHMDPLCRHLKYPQSLPQGTCRIEWINYRHISAIKMLQVFIQQIHPGLKYRRHLLMGNNHTTYYKGKLLWDSLPNDITRS